MKIKKFSKLQENGFDAVSNSAENLFLSAVAGSGKTTWLVEACKRLPLSVKAVFCAFNKHIADELRGKLPKNVPAATLHSLGFATIRQNLANAVHVCEDKTDRILEQFIKVESEEYKFNAAPIKKLVSLAKNNYMVKPEKADWDSLIEQYGVILPNGSFDWTALNETYALATARQYKAKLYNKFFKREVELPVIDFDDMLFYPAIEGWNIAKNLNCLFVDESQDLNAVQIKLLETANKNGTRIICVGDSAQAIYGFRGASIESIDNLTNLFNMKTLPLSVTYRCSKAVVEYAKRYVPEIEAREGAPEGNVSEISLANLKVESFRHGDLVVCRTNAPLVGLAYALLRLNSGIKFRIQGVELGQELGRLVGYLTFKNNLQDVDMAGFMKALSVYEQHMTEKYMQLKANGEKYIAELQDKLEVISLVAGNSKTISGIKINLCKLFADSDDRNCVLLSSIHRAKGLEVLAEDNTCIVLRTDLLPHPKATRDWELIQESNLIYVAYTRAKSNLVLVHKEK